jgi:hypothetical protein
MALATPGSPRVYVASPDDVSGKLDDMADSGAVRTMRYKRHKAGDHSMCRGECAKPRLVVNVTAADTTDLDPVTEMRNLAVRLAQAYSQDPANAALARELRATLLSIPVEEEYVPDRIDLLNMQRARRRNPEIEEMYREFEN